MCIRVIERYAICGCKYHVHSIDACAAYGQHAISDKVVYVGYACPQHSLAWKADELDDQLSETSSVFSSQTYTSSVTSAQTTDMVDTFTERLLSIEPLVYLWPQIALRCNTRARCEQVIERFLQQYAQDLRKIASTSTEVEASRLVRTRRRYISSKIAEGHCWDDRQTPQHVLPAREGRIEVLPCVDDESDAEDVDLLAENYYPQLDDFLFKSNAIVCLQDSIKKFLRPEYTMTILERWLEVWQVGFHNLYMKLTERPIPEGARRIHWTCRCSRSLYDDYFVRRDETLNEITELLEYSPRLFRPDTQESKHSKAWRFWQAAMVSIFKLSPQSDMKTPGLPQHLKDQENLNPGECRKQQDPNNGHNFILFCVPFMRWAVKVCHADICWVKSDQDLFRLMRICYIMNRGPFRRIRLRKVKAIHFVEFDMYRNAIADIRMSPSLPPVEAFQDYTYHPMPADKMPPLGPNLLMHFYEHPDHAEVLPTLLKKFPRKLRQKLEACPQRGSSVGWGIQFIEGIDTLMLFCFGTFGFAICLLIATTWTVVRQDIQGGFGIGGFLLAFILFCVGVIQFGN